LLLWRFKPNVLPGDPDELVVCGVSCLLPVIFSAARNSRLDRWIGELSYPVYLNHMLVMNIVGHYINDPASHLGVSILVSIVASMIVVLVMEHPLAQFRHKMFYSRPEDDAVPSSAAAQGWTAVPTV
jgi:peptidoglycan/LPS O-acetylase OafA/YrhL